jgi:hypothetical protein
LATSGAANCGTVFQLKGVQCPSLMALTRPAVARKSEYTGSPYVVGNAHDDEENFPDATHHMTAVSTRRPTHAAKSTVFAKHLPSDDTAPRGTSSGLWSVNCLVGLVVLMRSGLLKPGDT